MKCLSRILAAAGLPLDTANVDRVADAGGKLLVTPNTNPAVIAHGVENRAHGTEESLILLRVLIHANGHDDHP